jgi:hypothetical protein
MNLSTGCPAKEPPRTAPAVPIVVERKLSGEADLIDEPALTQLVAERAKLATSGAGEPYRVRCKATSERGPDKIGVRVELVLEEQKLGGRQLRMDGVAELPTSKTTPPQLARRLLGDILEEVGTRLRLYYDPPPVVVAALASKSHEIQLEALEACGERKLAPCAEPLIALLKSEDLDLRDRAIGSLQRLGDRRAIRPLTDVAKFGEIDELPKILQAVASIGGPEARAYLEFVANGHDQAAIRALAQRHLSAMTQ